LLNSGSLWVNLSWNKRAATTFTVSHSGHAKYVDGAVPTQYAEVTVAGVPAYWQLSSPVTGDPGAVSVISLKSGYVVMLTSMGLSQSEVDHALAVILNHL
jgi:hypothetical protein